MKPPVTTKERTTRNILDALREVLAKYKEERRWGSVTISFMDGKPTVIEQKVTEKLSD